MKKEYRINGMRTILTEDQEQTWLFSWASAMEYRYPELSLMYHIPNGGKRSKAEAVRFKAMGVKAGVSDIHLPVARGGYYGLYIELKALDGRPTQNQKDFLSAVQKQGYLGAFAYGGEEAARIIEDYLGGKIRKVLVEVGSEEG